MTSPPDEKPQPFPTPKYYEGLSLADMEARLRADYLTKSGWLESAEAKLALRDGKPIPWFSYSAIRFLEQELSPDLSLFEYGAGQSTRYWGERLSRVVAVDHDPTFATHAHPNDLTNVQVLLVEEHAELTDAQRPWADKLPPLTDPERTLRTYRSGQLNEAFRAYALKLLEFPADAFDVVIVDGMARVLSAWAAIQHFERGGFIVFDNSDRGFYEPAYRFLEQGGYRRLDFWGMSPINPYEMCTSVFYRPSRFAGTVWFQRGDETPAPLAHAAGTELGILVLGFNRPYHLQSVLESLRLQGRISDVHVWIDGTQGRGEYQGANDKSVEIARRYAIKELRALNSHLGIEKMMLDALDEMTCHYSRILVLEDDCFPVEGAVEAFEQSLDEVAADDRVYSVYGHHFGTEPVDELDFTRFQGWGWAAHSNHIRALLPQLRQLFSMGERTYLAYIEQNLTADIRDRLDRTPGRDVLGVLSKFFSWDSATAFLTAQADLVHRRTPAVTIINTGIIEGIGHFRQDTPRLRQPPLNMITLAEAWDRFDQNTPACDRGAPTYGLDGLDRRILDAIDLNRPGFFVELGAFDGVTQSNSVLLETHGWRGLLIEANPGAYAKCVKARPGATVEHAACVASNYEAAMTKITDVGLMSMTTESHLADDERASWIERGEGFAGRPRQEIEVPAATLSELLDKHGIEKVDLLLLDVEGAEVEVLNGIDFDRHAPTLIVAEDAYHEGITACLAPHGYKRDAILLERRYTRDCLYKRT